MQKRMERELADSDAALFMLNGDQQIGPGDRFIAEAVKRSGLPVVTAVNKVDLLSRARVLDALQAAADLDVPGEIFPVSARTGAGVPEVLEALVGVLPEAPLMYPPEDHTDLPENVRIAELIREQVLRRMRHELPHAVEVEVEEIDEREDGMRMIEARMWAETESQKAILIGSGGSMVRAIGTSARQEIEALLGARVHLDLSVRVRKGWRGDEALLDRLGIE
jgi:GTP-binding protein Era